MTLRECPPSTSFRTVWCHMRRHLIAGLFVIVPLVVTILILRLLFHTMAMVLGPLIRQFVSMNPLVADMTAVAALVVLVYLAGVISAYFIGQRAIAFGENILRRIPFVSDVYLTAKRVVHMFSLSDVQGFKRVVLLEFPRPGIWAIGFVTGSMTDEKGVVLYTVFIPTAPNPTTGFLELVEADQLRESGLTTEQAIAMVVSGGVIAPPTIGQRGQVPPVALDNSTGSGS